MANKTNCPYCGKTNVSGKKEKPYVYGATMVGAGIGGTCGAGIFSVPLAAVGAAAGAAAGKVISHFAPNEIVYKCPRCGAQWREKINQ